MEKFSCIFFSLPPNFHIEVTIEITDFYLINQVVVSHTVLYTMYHGWHKGYIWQPVMHDDSTKGENFSMLFILVGAVFAMVKILVSYSANDPFIFVICTVNGKSTYLSFLLQP